jgi:hypothetical protein
LLFKNINIFSIIVYVGIYIYFLKLWVIECNEINMIIIIIWMIFNTIKVLWILSLIINQIIIIIDVYRQMLIATKHHFVCN